MKYIIFNNQLQAKQVSFKACKQTDGITNYKWIHLLNNDKSKSCLRLKYQADYTDIDGSNIHPKCEYNDFKDFYKDIDYIELNSLDESWDNNFNI